MKVNFFIYVLLLVLVSGCAGCNISGSEEKVPERKDSVTIMTWNVQTLFDGTDDGTEYDDFRESAGWGREKYRGRLNVIAGAIGGMERKPDIIALQEIESAQVMADLASALSVHGYGWTHFAVIPGMALGLGLLSRLPLDGAKSHSVYINGEIAPRPMLEARINMPDANNAALALFVCHWKSKLGGDEATEEGRRASARVILRRVREIALLEPQLPILIMGDLNENHDEFYRRKGNSICALLPDDPQCAKLTGGKSQLDFLVISGDKPPQARFFGEDALAFYSPWMGELKNGSYFYKNNWETIDHFLLSGGFFDNSGWNFDNCKVIDYPPFINSKGSPMAYDPKTGAGMSDHLPLLLFLSMR